MENNSQAIEIKGIVRNQTKIGVQDGQCDDIVNLRFKDGSWRVADDGKMIVNSAGTPFSVYPYTQLYVHTNVYHHLLGVTGGKLWWFANIDADNETFSYVTDNEGDPDAIEICDVQGDVTIVQNGHLLTIISTASSVTTPLPLATPTEDVIKYAIFKTGMNEYKVLKVDQNGEQTDRGIFPYGRAHFNTISGISDEFALSPKEFGDKKFPTHYEAEPYIIEKLAEKGLVSMPFLVIVAVKDYSGNYIFASNPQYIFPNEKLRLLQRENKCLFIRYTYDGSTGTGAADDPFIFPILKAGIVNLDNAEYSENSGDYIIYAEGEDNDNVSYLNEPVAFIGVNSFESFPKLMGTNSGDRARAYGSKLTLSLQNYDFLKENEDTLKSLCVFVTRQVSIYPTSADDLSEVSNDMDEKKYRVYYVGEDAGYDEFYASTKERNLRDEKYIIDDLIKSPFYLLREYNLHDITELKNNPIINLGDPEYKDVLKPDVLIQRDTIGGIAFDRKSFLPKTAYMYNQKLHIANYKTTQFHGYPIDCFQFSNHSVKVEKGSYAVGGVLPNLKDGVDVQYPRTQYPFMNRSAETFNKYIQVSKEKGYCFASIRVIIETQQGDQQVVRYIQPYEAHKFTNGDNANFVESLGALLSFPDYRAKKMEVAVISLHEGRVYRRSKTFALTPHPYLNIAYYIEPQLKPIVLPIEGSSSDVELDDFITTNSIALFVTPSEKNNTEDYPNGLKVSEVNNPFTFPYKSTYQVGSSDIVALMSNAVAVGTGQTGAAPLYVFCKDGIYSLMVDSSGEMTYTNARIIARYVCNNAKSVTPIDNGVVFTTDRGLMSIAGSEVVEIGSAAEGDVFDITDTSDKAQKIMFNAFTMPQLAEFPQSLIDNTDFLTYIKGAIVNYNHNERELMVSNPSKDYTYVMDRNGNWSRRAFTAQEYVNNYPTSYRIDKAGNFYKVDADGNDTNKVYLLSNVIKLGTIAFKQAYRLVVRGYFETTAAKLGLYVFGSYDGRQWALLGGNERDGQFTDIGCKISHTDIRFLRVCLAGKLSKDARIDYIEVSADGSALNGKLR